MSIGKSFLSRVLHEDSTGTDDLSSIKKRIADVKKSAGGEMFNITDVIVDIGSMLGIPARVLKANVAELKTSIRSAADRIKLAPTESTNLSTLHQALLAANVANAAADKQVKEDKDDTSFHGKVISVLKSLGYSEVILNDDAAKTKIAATIVELSDAGAVKRVINRMASFMTNEGVEGSDELSSNQLVNDAVKIIRALGLDVLDQNIVKTGKNMAIQKAILTALRMNPALKQAMRAFLSKVK
jgi:hypothetical protein